MRSSLKALRPCLRQRQVCGHAVIAAWHKPRRLRSTRAVVPPELLDEARYLERHDLRAYYDEHVSQTSESHSSVGTSEPGNSEPGSSTPHAQISWCDFKKVVDAAAVPVDPRVLPMYASLTLSFVAQGIQVSWQRLKPCIYLHVWSLLKDHCSSPCE